MHARITALLVALFLSVCTNFAQAQQAPAGPHRVDCEKLSWPVNDERVWFANKTLARRASGARLKRIDRAVTLFLKPSDQVEYFLPPEVKLNPRGFSGEVTFFGVPRPGIYQVTLSAPASIDVFENGTRLKPIGYTSADNCPGVFESVRYDLAAGDLVLVQITNASTNSIKVAFNAAKSIVAW